MIEVLKRSNDTNVHNFFGAVLRRIKRARSGGAG
jgi:hypothetical protein